MYFEQQQQQQKKPFAYDFIGHLFPEKKKLLLQLLQYFWKTDPERWQQGWSL